VKTEDLIIELARDVTPVTRLKPPVVRLLSWVVLALVTGAAALAVFGVRPDRATMGTAPQVWIDAIAALAMTVAAAHAALVLAVPGAERRGVSRWVTVAIAAAWAGQLTVAMVAAGDAAARVDVWYVCALRITLIAIPPAVALAVMVQRGAPLRPVWTAALILASSTAAGAAATVLLCEIPHEAHVLAGHVGPIVLWSLMAAVLQKTSGAVLRGT
jgi:hypothetical protein